VRLERLGKLKINAITSSGLIYRRSLLPNFVIVTSMWNIPVPGGDLSVCSVGENNLFLVTPSSFNVFPPCLYFRSALYVIHCFSMCSLSSFLSSFSLPPFYFMLV
jgi:hypothetical protein